MIEDHFRTTFVVKSLKKQVSYSSQLLLIGSCFSENIGHRLKERQFRTAINPAGISYNPISIVQTLNELLTGKKYSEADLEYNGENWFSYAHHGSFSHPDQQTCLHNIQEAADRASESLSGLDYLMITLGTAWVYERKDTGDVVANCHKVPQQQFVKRMLNPQEIIDALEMVLNKIRKQRPDIEVIFTVSPVRHIRDGVEQDRLSKSVLRWAVQCLTEKQTNHHYFPAYELLTDDLRDYRFYKEDMVHPSDLALNYVWNKFKQACISETSYPLMKEFEKLNAAVAHRPIHEKSEAHQKFMEEQLKKIDALESTHHFLDLTSYKNQLKNS